MRYTFYHFTLQLTAWNLFFLLQTTWKYLECNIDDDEVFQELLNGQKMSNYSEQLGTLHACRLFSILLIQYLVSVLLYRSKWWGVNLFWLFLILVIKCSFDSIYIYRNKMQKVTEFVTEYKPCHQRHKLTCF